MARSRSSGPASSVTDVQKHRKTRHAAGLRPIQIWIPEVRSKNFALEARRQCRAIARSAQERDDLAFIGSLASDSGLRPVSISFRGQCSITAAIATTRSKEGWSRC